MKHHIVNLLSIIIFIFIAFFSQSCIEGGDKHYHEWKPTEAEKKKIIEQATKKMIEQHEKSEKN